jgi:molecular chaperone DnaK (HSP70)
MAPTTIALPDLAPMGTFLCPPALNDITNAAVKTEQPFNGVNPDETRKRFPHRGDAELVPSADQIEHQSVSARQHRPDPPQHHAYYQTDPGTPTQPAQPLTARSFASSIEQPVTYTYAQSVDDGVQQPASGVSAGAPQPQPTLVYAQAPQVMERRSSTGSSGGYYTESHFSTSQPSTARYQSPGRNVYQSEGARSYYDSAQIVAPQTTPSGPVLGIDFGSFACRVAIAEPEQSMPELVRNSHGSLQTRSIVALPENRERAIGCDAEEQVELRPLSAFHQLKRLLDLVVKGSEDPTPDGVQFSVLDRQGVVQVVLGPGADPTCFNPQQLVAMLLGKLKEFADTHTAVPNFVPPAVVLAAPANWSAEHKQALKEAAIIAGMPGDKITVVSDSMAKLLWYRYSHYNDLPLQGHVTVMIVDVGHCYSSACVAHIARTHVESVATCCCPVGSHAVDVELAKRARCWIDSEFSFQADQVPKAHAKLASACRNVRETLSSIDKTVLQCPVGEDSEIQYAIERTLISECADELTGTVAELCAVTLEQAGLQKSEVDYVELVGGGARMPVVMDSLKSFWGAEAPLRLTMDTDLSVCQGAALMGLQLLIDAGHAVSAIHAVDLSPAVPAATDIPATTPSVRMQPMIQLEKNLRQRDNTFGDHYSSKNELEDFIFRIRGICKQPHNSSKSDVQELMTILDQVEETTSRTDVALPSREGYEKSLAGLKAAVQTRFPDIYAEFEGRLPNMGFAEAQHPTSGTTPSQSGAFQGTAVSSQGTAVSSQGTAVSSQGTAVSNTGGSSSTPVSSLPHGVTASIMYTPVPGKTPGMATRNRYKTPPQQSEPAPEPTQPAVQAASLRSRTPTRSPYTGCASATYSTTPKPAAAAAPTTAMAAPTTYTAPSNVSYTAPPASHTYTAKPASYSAAEAYKRCNSPGRITRVNSAPSHQMGSSSDTVIGRKANYYDDEQVDGQPHPMAQSSQYQPVHTVVYSAPPPPSSYSAVPVPGPASNPMMPHQQGAPSHQQLALDAKNRGDAEFREHKWMESTQSYRQAIEYLNMLPADPQRDERAFACHLNVAMAACKSEKYAVALEHGTRAAELRPGSAQAWLWTGQAQLGLGQYDAANSSLKQSQKLAQASGDQAVLQQLQFLEQKYKGKQKSKHDKCIIS